MIAKSKNRNPYPGPRPFEPEESGIFFGREREVRELVSLITAHRVVLLYAQSGAGKTSLLNAGVIPFLTKEGFEVLPITRVRGFKPQDIDLSKIPNIYAFNALMEWAMDSVQPTSLMSTSVGTFLKEREHLADEQGLSLPRVAIFDQFEELFTSYPDRWKEREEFFRQVAEALEADPLLRILFVIREDYLASLDSYVDLLPERLRTRYRLRRLHADAACQAVEGPLRDTGRKFAEGVALRLVNKLLNIRVENPAGKIVETPGEYVEPVQLQIVCQSLWRNLPKEVTVIVDDHLKQFGDVQEVLRSFYERAIETAKRQTGVSESDLRRWFNDKLITPAGTRGTVFQGKEQTEGIPNLAVNLLEAQHIIRAEMRAGARWYELTHDRLIEPIRKANSEAQARTTRRLYRLAAAFITFCTLTAIISIGVFLSWCQPKTYSLTAKAGTGGAINPSGEVTISSGADQSFLITSEEGYRIDDVLVDGNSYGAKASYTFTKVTTDHTIDASFTMNTYNLTITAVDGSVTKSPDQISYKHTEKVILKAVPNEGYTFTNWSGQLSGPANPTELFMDADKVVTANFAPKSDSLKGYKLEVTAVNGSVTKSPDKAFYNYGETVILEAVANMGYTFTNWSGDLSDSNNPVTLVMDANKSVDADFAALKAGDCVTNSLGMKLVYIPAGKFMMGSSDTAEQLARKYSVKAEVFADRFPQHLVSISKGFLMGQTEVTQGQYKAVMNAQPWSGSTNVQEDANNPAVCVTWYDAVEFCRKLTRWEGKTYRLPTEAEWEYACRAGTTTQFSFVDSNSTLGDNAWFADNTVKVGEPYAHPVGQKKPNPWGLYDMHGNVYEWCSDWYDKDYYSKSPSVDPKGPLTGVWRVRRSGQWAHGSGRSLHSSFRYDGGPGNRSFSVGFRVVRQPYSLTIKAIGGSVVENSDQAGYSHGQAVILLAQPNDGYSFTNWSGDLSGSANPATLLMDADKSITAKFVPNSVVTPPGFYIHNGCVPFSDQENVINKGPITSLKVCYDDYIYGLQLRYDSQDGLFIGLNTTEYGLQVREWSVPKGEQIVRVEGRIAKYGSGFRYVSYLQFITDKGTKSLQFGEQQGTQFVAADKNGLPLRTISGWTNLRKHPSLKRAITSMTFHFGD